MAAPTYTPLPTAPARTDAPSVFATRADAFLGALATFQTEGDALGVFAEAQAAIAEAAAQDLLTTFTDFSGDVDTLTANGVYKLAAGVTNAFTGAGDNDFLFNLYTDASNSVQVGYEGGAYMHMRSKVGGTWGAWGGLIASATESAEGIVQQATFTDATTGTQNTKYMTPLRTKQAIDQFSVLSASYTSSGQTITSGGGLTLAHGLGAMPALIQLHIKCTTADLGYSIGDIVLIGPGYHRSGPQGVSTVPDATNINIRISSDASPIAVLVKSTGANGFITEANWDLYARAWA